jgi:hypothetical protein
MGQNHLVITLDMPYKEYDRHTFRIENQSEQEFKTAFAAHLQKYPHSDIYSYMCQLEESKQAAELGDGYSVGDRIPIDDIEPIAYQLNP